MISLYENGVNGILADEMVSSNLWGCVGIHHPFLSLQINLYIFLYFISFSFPSVNVHCMLCALHSHLY